MSNEWGSYAYFNITSSRTLAELEALMGSAGDGKCWSKGDLRTSQNQLQHRFSRWSLLSGVERGRPIDEHLCALWRRMADYRRTIIDLPEDVYRRVCCVGVFNSHLDRLEIASGHFTTAAYYGLTLDCDFYYEDDFGDVDLGKPYWSW